MREALPYGAPEAYGDLCKILMPRSICDERELENVKRVMNWIAVRAQTKDQYDYAGTLADLVTIYEIEHGLRAPAEPIHPGEILLEEFMKPRNISVEELAEKMNIQAYRLKRIIRGDWAIGDSTASKLAAVLGTSPDVWIKLQQGYDDNIAIVRILRSPVNALRLFGALSQAQRDASAGLGFPLDWFPRLLHASPEQREKFELSLLGVHWPDLREEEMKGMAG